MGKKWGYVRTKPDLFKTIFPYLITRVDFIYREIDEINSNVTSMLLKFFSEHLYYFLKT